jgi:hypothetical protein
MAAPIKIKIVFFNIMCDHTISYLKIQKANLISSIVQNKHTYYRGCLSYLGLFKL